MQTFFKRKKCRILQIVAKIPKAKSTIIFEHYMLIVLFIHSFIHSFIHHHVYYYYFCYYIIILIIIIIVIITTFKQNFHIEEYSMLFTIRYKYIFVDLH